MNLMMENNGMRDIVERLELQAFVADKIQSGMKPLIMDCLDEITRLRAENEKLRRDVRTAVMGDSAELQDVKRENKKLRRALAPFATAASHFKDECRDTLVVSIGVDVGYLRAAASAIRESGDAH